MAPLRDNGITNNHEADLFFSFDPIATIGGNWFMAPAFESREVERRGDKRILINGDGLYAEVPLTDMTPFPTTLSPPS